MCSLILECSSSLNLAKYFCFLTGIDDISSSQPLRISFIQSGVGSFSSFELERISELERLEGLLLLFFCMVDSKEFPLLFLSLSLLLLLLLLLFPESLLFFGREEELTSEDIERDSLLPLLLGFVVVVIVIEFSVADGEKLFFSKFLSSSVCLVELDGIKCMVLDLPRGEFFGEGELFFLVVGTFSFISAKNDKINLF